MTFIDGVGAQHRVDKIGGKFLHEVEGVVLARAGGLRFFLEAVEFLLLSDIRRKGNDLSGVMLLEPTDEDGGVEPSRVCEYDFHFCLT